MTKILVSLLVLVFASACASKGFNRGALREEIGVVKPQFDDKEIKEAYNKKSNLPKPFKLAVYYKQPSEKGTAVPWLWTDKDKSQLDEVATELKSSGLVSDIFPIVSSIVTSEDLKSLRLIAAKHQADALLIIGGGAQIDRYTNAWAATYILLLPTLFVPGSQVDAIFLSNASMWDVKNEYLYLTAETEATSSEKYAAVLGKSDRELISETKTQSLAKLKDQLKAMIKGTKF